MPDATASTSTVSASLVPPVHESLPSTHRHHTLHVESDFATVFQFLKRFRRMGLKISMDATIAVRNECSRCHGCCVTQLTVLMVVSCCRTWRMR